MEREEQSAPPGEEPTGRIARANAYRRAQAERANAWAEAKRTEAPWAAWLYDVYERDRECAGGLLSGALAYRFFIWLLPFALVLVEVSA